MSIIKQALDTVSAHGGWGSVFQHYPSVMVAANRALSQVPCPFTGNGKTKFRLYKDWEQTGAGYHNDFGRIATGIDMIMKLEPECGNNPGKAAKLIVKLLGGSAVATSTPKCAVTRCVPKIDEHELKRMKGTLDAAVPDAENVILADKKETAEHYTIVDLLRNDLSIVAKNVRVNRFRYIEKLTTSSRTLLQVSSEIEGTLPDNYKSKLGDIFAALLPAGSISGAPKKKTVQIIKDHEIDARGYYTGVFGVFDGQNVDSAVMIRFIENTDGNLTYRSGCGITALSDCEAEYKEMIAKVYVPVGRKY